MYYGTTGTYSLDYKVIAELVERFNAMPVEVENILNAYIHGETPAILRNELAGVIPVSDRNKKHAAHYKMAFGRQENYNLAVKLLTGRNFNYLVFPDEALGTSKVNEPQNFTGRALEQAMPDLIDNMNEYVKNMLDF